VLFDVGFTLVRRALAGEPLTRPHRGHLYQVAQRSGVPAATVTLVHWGFAAFGGLCCLTFLKVSGNWKLVMLGATMLPQLLWLSFVVRAAHRKAIEQWG